MTPALFQANHVAFQCGDWTAQSLDVIGKGDNWIEVSGTMRKGAHERGHIHFTVVGMGGDKARFLRQDKNEPADMTFNNIGSSASGGGYTVHYLD